MLKQAIQTVTYMSYSSFSYSTVTTINAIAIISAHITDTVTSITIISSSITSVITVIFINFIAELLQWPFWTVSLVSPSSSTVWRPRGRVVLPAWRWSTPGMPARRLWRVPSPSSRRAGERRNALGNWPTLR